VQGAADVPRLHIVLDAPDATEIRARLDVTWPDQQRSTRTLAAVSCEEANAALAFLITLALDPSAAPASATAPRPSEPSGPQPLAFERFELGPVGQLLFGPAPGAMFGLGLQLTATWHGAGPWLPALRLSATYGWQRDASAAGGTADFSLEALRLALCPLGARWGQWRAQACLGAGLGRLRASGAGSFAPQSHSR